MALAAGQAVFLAWLTAFSRNAYRLDELKVQFWIFSSLAAAFLCIGVLAIVVIVRRFIKARRKPSGI